MTNPHYFIAISLPRPLKQKLAKWQGELKNVLSYKQWPHKDDLHITLKFLGEMDDNMIDMLHQKLTQLTTLKPFYTTIDSVGTFGHPERPRVVWAGVHLNKDLIFLQDKVEKLSMEAGFKKESRKYIPHITLAKKWKEKANKEMFEDIKKDIKDL